MLGGLSPSGQIFFFSSKIWVFGGTDTSLKCERGVQVKLPVGFPIIGSKAAYLTGATLSVPSSGYHQKPYPPQGESIRNGRIQLKHLCVSA